MRGHRTCEGTALSQQRVTTHEEPPTCEGSATRSSLCRHVTSHCETRHKRLATWSQLDEGQDRERGHIVLRSVGEREGDRVRIDVVLRSK